MWVYIVRRVLYAIPIILGVNVITFALFFMVNTPDDMARMHLGDKHVSEAAVQRWKAEQGYDLPLFYNTQEKPLAKVTHTLFFQKTKQLMFFQFGSSTQGRDIGHDISQRMWPSLALAVPTIGSARSNQNFCLPVMAIIMLAKHWTAAMLSPSWPLTCPRSYLLSSFPILTQNRICRPLAVRCILITPLPPLHQWRPSLVSASTTRSIFCFPAEQQALPNASSMALGEQRCSMSRNCACKVM